MFGPAGVVKICAAADSTNSGVGDHSAVCNGSGLMQALNVVHPAGALLKEAVHGQQVARPHCAHPKNSGLLQSETRHARSCVYSQHDAHCMLTQAPMNTARCWHRMYAAAECGWAAA